MLSSKKRLDFRLWKVFTSFPPKIVFFCVGPVTERFCAVTFENGRHFQTITQMFNLLHLA